MPWKASDVDSHIKGLSDHQKAVWVRVANAILQECSGDDCEGKAIRQANSVAKRAPETAKEAQVIPLELLVGPLSEAELSLDQRRNAVHQALLSQTTAKLGTSCWIRDLYDDYVVYELEGPAEMGLYRRDYTIADDGTVTLGDAQPVRLVTSYEPVAAAVGEAVTEAEEPVDEGSGQEFVGDVFPLSEGALRKDGTLPIKIIQPGWGSTGYYAAEVLKRDGPKIFPVGTHMYWDHPRRSEESDRPERSLRDLAAVTVSSPRWDERGHAGPGLYAEAKVFHSYRPIVEEMAPHIGVSIRGMYQGKDGQAEGRRGRLIERLVLGQSIDFVTKAGAGGKVLQLFEAARGKGPTEQEDTVTEAEAQALREAQTAMEARVQQLEEAAAAKDQELARLREGAVLTEARTVVAQELNRTSLPVVTRERLANQLVVHVPVKEGAIDREAFATQIDEAVKAEVDYLTRLGDLGHIRGMGPKPDGGATGTAEEAEADLARELQVMGLSESAAKLAAAGR